MSTIAIFFIIFLDLVSFGPSTGCEVCAFTFQIRVTCKGSASLAIFYSNSVPHSPPHWPYPQRIRPPSWPRLGLRHCPKTQKNVYMAHMTRCQCPVPNCDQWSATSGESIMQSSFISRRITNPVLNWWLHACETDDKYELLEALSCEKRQYLSLTCMLTM